MKKIIWMLVVVTLVSCDSDDDLVPSLMGERYIDSVFTDINIELNIQYGSNNSLSGNKKNLFLDIYTPNNDTLSERPTIVLAHGGAFIGGNKSDLETLCISYASMGYTVASVGYNLLDDRFISDSVRFSEGVVIALGDFKGAIRYLRDNAINGNNDYGINSELMFAGGISAGAILANHAGMLDSNDPAIPDYLQNHIDNNGGFEGDTNDLTVSSEVSGVLSFSGSLLRSHWIDENDPPIFMVHEELDPVVPCDYSASVLFPFPILAYGACALQNQIAEVGIKNEFVFYEGASEHVGYFTNDDEGSQKELIKTSATFLAEIIL
ncbi:Acetyl esterase/lipase [Ekhidna lutea]|uniref:Acetyl esterase/lipase n=2 Tax=Ekhidna lutea TaxID=447679 RepID=A0A239L9K1_EKHLU|nr:Acetyl esterase/lipase [Ekhidna lutea]